MVERAPPAHEAHEVDAEEAGCREADGEGEEGEEDEGDRGLREGEGREGHEGVDGACPGMGVVCAKSAGVASASRTRTERTGCAEGGDDRLPRRLCSEPLEQPPRDDPREPHVARETRDETGRDKEGEVLVLGRRAREDVGRVEVPERGRRERVERERVEQEVRECLFVRGLARVSAQVRTRSRELVRPAALNAPGARRYSSRA